MKLQDLQTLKRVYEAGLTIHHLGTIETDDKEIKSAIDALSKAFERCLALIISQKSDELIRFAIVEDPGDPDHIEIMSPHTNDSMKFCISDIGMLIKSLESFRQS